MMDKDILYRISAFQEEKFKRHVAKLGIDDLKELKNYFDRAMPTAKKNKDVNLKIRLANYNYLTSYINYTYSTVHMTDDQTMNRIKLEEQKESSIKKLKRVVDGEMKSVIAKYKIAQNITINLILATGDHYVVMLDDFPMTWREMKHIYDRGFIWDSEPDDCGKMLSIDSYKKISNFRLKGGEIIFIRNSQIAGMIVDEETTMAKISEFVSELVVVANKYNLSDLEIDNYFNSISEW